MPESRQITPSTLRHEVREAEKAFERNSPGPSIAPGEFLPCGYEIDAKEDVVTKNTKRFSLKKGVLYPVLALCGFELFYIPVFMILWNFIDGSWTQLICDAFIRLPAALWMAKKLAKQDGVEQEALPAWSVALLVITWILTVCLPMQLSMHAGDAPREGLYAYEMINLMFVAPFVEEAFYRGVLFRVSRRGLGFKAAVVVNILIFNAMHYGMLYLFVTLPVAVACCALMEKTGRIRYGMMLHFAFNVLGAAFTLTNFPIDFIWLYLIVPVGLIAICRKLFPKKKERGRDPGLSPEMSNDSYVGSGGLQDPPSQQ